MPTEPTTVTLGDRNYLVVPQKHTAIKKGVTRIFESFGDDGLDITADGGVMAVIESKAWEAIELFIPGVERLQRDGRDTTNGLMSREDFMGTGPDGDAHVPTIPEIREAISAGLKVNGLSGFTALKELLPMELIKALVSQQIAEAVATSTRKSLQSSPSPSGESPSTISGTSRPTSPESPSASPVPVSDPSPETATSVSDESFATLPTQ